MGFIFNKTVTKLLTILKNTKFLPDLNATSYLKGSREDIKS